jgi:hypothetical protein
LKHDPKYLYALTLIYFAVSLIGIWHHEFFIDEAHHWLLARDSHSVAELFANTRIEGHPLLWSLMLYAITRFTSDPFWMQFLHILISTSAVFVFLRKAPFSWVFKILFIFGYFMIFEYNLISRNYMLGILFLFLACSVFRDRQQKFISLCVFLALAANTHLMFSVIAFALFLTLLLENWNDGRLFTRESTIGYAVFVLGLVSIMLQIQHTNSDWLLEPIRQLPLSERLIKGAASLFKGLINIPDFRTMYFWNSNYFTNALRPLAAVLVVAIYLLPLALFAKNKKTLFFVYTALIGTQIFFFITQRAATRFQGMTFIIVIVALWIENYYRPENSKLKDLLHSLKLTLFKKPIVYGILAIQLFSGIYAYTMDYLYPFTSAKSTVDFFYEQGLADREIVSVTCDGTLISAYLERKIWFLCDGGYESFCHWDSGCAGTVTAEKALVMLTDYMQTHNDVIFVSYYPLSKTTEIGRWMPINEKVKFRFLKKFDINMVDKTYYYVFEVSKK